MHGRIAVHFGGGGLQDAGAHPFGHAEHIDGPHDAGLDRLDRIVLIMDRRSRTGHIVDPIHFEKNGFDDIVADKLEIRFADQIRDIPFAAREEIVQTNHIVTFGHQSPAEMGADETGTARNQYAHALLLVTLKQRSPWRALQPPFHPRPTEDRIPKTIVVKSGGKDENIH